MNRLLLACAVVVSMGPLLGAGGQILPPLRAGQAAAASDGPIELVFLRDRGPLLVRLHVELDGKPIHEQWTAYLERWFTFLDRKNDGRLDKAALAGAPKAPFMRSLAQQGFFLPNRGTALALADFGKSASQTVSKAEFIDYYKKNVGSPVQPTLPSSQAAGPANDTLFKKLDTNQDGRLARAEIQAARNLTELLDTDDDELIFLRELAPGLESPIVRGVDFRPMTTPQPIKGVGSVHVTADNTRAGLAAVLLARYDKDKRQTVTRDEIGLDEAAFARLDGNKNGVLDLVELSAIVKNGPTVELTVNLRAANQTPVVSVLKLGALDAPQARQVGDALTLALGDADIAVQNAGAVAGRIAFTPVNALTQQFKQADVKKRGYVQLDDLDGGERQFLRTLFPVLDRDQDGKLTEAETEAYARVMEGARNLMASFSVQEQGRNWFQTLDANRDGQLTPRELLTAWDRLAAFDKNGDGIIDATELPLQFRVDFSPGSQGFAVALAARGFSAPAAARGNYPPQAPLWFQRMDRNRDGDVSHREFLGAREDFERLDINGDGLLDVDEAASKGPNR